MRDHSNHKELSREDAVGSMLSMLPPDFAADIEQVSLGGACGRVLMQDVTALADVPDVLTCCMDSIAVRWDDFADLPEGALPDTSQWVRGEHWEFANTGVAMPEGFDTAIVIEHVEVDNEGRSIVVHAAPSTRFAGTRAPASRMHRGDTVAKSGCVITPDIAARIAAGGRAAISVARKPRVAFIPTGNELVGAGLPYPSEHPERFAGRGRVWESNSAMVRGKVEAWGGEYVPFDIVADDEDAIRDALMHACAVADIVVLNAGSSKGSDDWSVEVMESIGSIICHQTNHGPGHHSSYALVDGVPIVGISGPSAGASFTLDFYLLPLMKRFVGLDPEPVTIPARLVEDVQPGRTAAIAVDTDRQFAGEQRPPEATNPGDTFFSVRFATLSVTPDGELVALPIAGHPGSPAAQHANAYFMAPSGPGAHPLRSGDIVWVELRDKRL